MTSMARGSTPNLQHSASHFCGGGVLLCWCQKAVISTAPQIADSKQKITGVFFLPWFSSHENYPGLVGCSLNCTKNNVLNVAPLPRLWTRVSMLDIFFLPFVLWFFLFPLCLFFLFISLLFYTLYFYELAFQQHLNCFFFSTLYKN